METMRRTGTDPIRSSRSLDGTNGKESSLVCTMSDLGKRVGAYLSFLAENAPFTEDLKTDVNHLIVELIKFWPLYPEWQAEADIVWEWIYRTVKTAPIVEPKPDIMMRISVSKENLAPGPPPEPKESEVIATIDAKTGMGRCFVLAPFEESPDPDVFSIASGLLFFCQPLAPLFPKAVKTKPKLSFIGETIYRKRNRDPFYSARKPYAEAPFPPLWRAAVRSAAAGPPSWRPPESASEETAETSFALERRVAEALGASFLTLESALPEQIESAEVEKQSEERAATEEERLIALEEQPTAETGSVEEVSRPEETEILSSGAFFVLPELLAEEARAEETGEEPPSPEAFPPSFASSPEELPSERAENLETLAEITSEVESELSEPVLLQEPVRPFPETEEAAGIEPVGEEPEAAAAETAEAASAAEEITPLAVFPSAPFQETLSSAEAEGQSVFLAVPEEFQEAPEAQGQESLGEEALTPGAPVAEETPSAESAAEAGPQEIPEPQVSERAASSATSTEAAPESRIERETPEAAPERSAPEKREEAPEAHGGGAHLRSSEHVQEASATGHSNHAVAHGAPAHSRGPLPKEGAWRGAALRSKERYIPLDASLSPPPHFHHVRWSHRAIGQQSTHWGSRPFGQESAASYFLALPFIARPSKENGRAPLPEEQLFYKRELAAAKARARFEEEMKIERRKRGTNKRTLSLRAVMDWLVPRKK